MFDSCWHFTSPLCILFQTAICLLVSCWFVSLFYVMDFNPLLGSIDYKYFSQLTIFLSAPLMGICVLVLFLCLVFGSFSYSCNQICHSFPSTFFISVLGAPHSQGTFFGLPLQTSPPFSPDLTLSLSVPFSLVLHVKPGGHPLTPCHLAHDPIQDTHIHCLYLVPWHASHYSPLGASGMQPVYTFGCDSNTFLKCNQHTCLLPPLARPGHTLSPTPRVSLQGHCFCQKRSSSHPGNSGMI